MKDVTTFDECLNELHEQAILANRTAISAINNSGYQSALYHMRLCLEYMCKAIVFIELENGANGINAMQGKTLERLIDYIKTENWITNNRKRKFHKLRALGNKGTHPKLLESCSEGRKLLNNSIIFFYSNYCHESCSDELKDLIKANPLVDKYLKYRTEYQKSTLGSGIPLSDLYIEQCFSLWKDSIDTNFDYNNQFWESPYTYNIHHLTNDFILTQEILNPAEYKNLLLVLGSPGQGKTSFCKKVLFDLIDKNGKSPRNLFHIRLREISDVDFFDQPLRYIYKTKVSPLLTEDEFKNSVLILDGLDELYMSRGKQLKEIDELLKNLLRNLSITDYRDIRIIVTSRIGYVNLDKLKNKNNLLLIKLNGFNKIQQFKWIYKFNNHPSNLSCSIKKSTIKTIHTPNNQGLVHFKEIFGQPVLLHLFVLSGLNVSTEIKRANVYENIFYSLWTRKWEKRGQLDALEKIDNQKLKSIVKDIAFAMYKEGKDFLTKKQVDEIPIVREFYNSINSDDEKTIGELYRYMFIAFYWNTKSNNQNEEVIEFLHKSLQEFLIAEKIWDEFKKINGVRDVDSILNKIGGFSSLRHIPVEIQSDIFEIGLELESQEEYLSLYHTLKNSFITLCNRHFMNKCLNREPIKGGIHSFRIYLLMIIALLKRINKERPKEEWTRFEIASTLNSFSDLMTFHHHYYPSIWDLSYCHFEGSYWNGGLTIKSLHNSIVEFSIFKKISFSDSSWTRTSFNNSEFQDSNIHRTKLHLSTFQNTIFSGFKAEGFSMYGCDFKNTTLKSSRFFKQQELGIIERCDFSETTIYESSFNQVRIVSSIFNNSSFYGSEKRLVQYLDGKLPKIIGLKTEFHSCEIWGSLFENAILDYARFPSSIIKGCNFENSKLNRTFFSQTKISMGPLRDKDEYYSDHKMIPTSFNFSEGENTNFYKTKLEGVSFKNVHYNKPEFNSSEILTDRLYNVPIPCLFDNSVLANAGFSNAKIVGASFKQTTMIKANFSNAKISSYEYEKYNTELGEYKEEYLNTNFEGAMLDESILKDCIIKSANMRGASFRNAIVDGASFENCDLSNTNFEQAKMFNVSLKGSNLQGANFSNVNWFDHSVLSLHLALYTLKNGTKDSKGYFHLSKEVEEDFIKLFVQNHHPVTQLILAKSLFNISGIPDEWINTIKNSKHKNLLTPPSKEANNSNDK